MYQVLIRPVRLLHVNIDMAESYTEDANASEAARCPCCEVKLYKHRTQFPVSATKRSHIGQILKRRTKNNRDAEQAGSFLFYLPPEIREMIWERALEPPDGTRSAHFHVYDRVFDSCTYHTPGGKLAVHRNNNRRHHRQTSLLLTCRAVYREAIHALYEHASFKLVVFAGYVRPHRHAGLNCVGRLRDCEKLFQRMRRVTVIVHAGKKPNIKKYITRLHEVLELLDFEHIQVLRLHFNFHLDFGCSQPIFAAFKPIGEIISRQRSLGKLEVMMCAWPGQRCHAGARRLGGELGGYQLYSYHMNCDGLVPDEEGSSRCMSPDKDAWTECLAEIGDACVVRGTMGLSISGSMQSSPWIRDARMEQARIGALFGLWMIFCPLTIPVTLASLAGRKIQKGEW